MTDREFTISEIEDMICANEIGVHATFSTMRWMIEKRDAKIAELEACLKETTITRNAAQSREQEANRDWSTEAKKWLYEKIDLIKQITELEPQWQPIESAPKDKPILVWNSFVGVYESTYRDIDGKEWPLSNWIYDGSTHYPKPSHWMPLPPPPPTRSPEKKT